MGLVNYETIKVRFQDSICFLEFNRPDAKNAINSQLIAECSDVLSVCEESATVVVLSGSPDFFCFGADFGAIAEGAVQSKPEDQPGPLFDLWLKLATGPYVSVSHVRGKANAGGLGFIGASDITLADDTAQFSLSELLFGLYPAVVLPFLIRRVGFQKAHYLTLMTQPISARQACEWGLVDSLDAQSEALLRRHLLRLRRLSKTAIRRYKTYVNSVIRPLEAAKTAAIQANLEVFSDAVNLEGIARYVKHGVFPWERP